MESCSVIIDADQVNDIIIGELEDIYFSYSKLDAFTKKEKKKIKKLKKGIKRVLEYYGQEIYE
jgi:hypothetical protein